MIKLSEPTESVICLHAMRIAGKPEQGKAHRDHLKTVWCNFLDHLPDIGINSEKALCEHFGVFYSERNR